MKFPFGILTFSPTSNFKLPTASIIVIVWMFAGLSSCKISKETIFVKKFDEDSVLAAFEKSAAQYEWLLARARVNYESQSGSKSFTAHVRMRKDSVVWVSITTILGVEVARVLIRDDTVFLLDRLNKKFQAESLSILEGYFPFPFDVALLQNILTGEPLLSVSGKTKIKRDNDQYVLFSENKIYDHEVFLNGHNLTISTEHFVDRQNDRRLSLVFDDYRNDAGRLFSYARNISFSGDDKITLNLKFSKIQWDQPLEFPFHVGEKYD